MKSCFVKAFSFWLGFRGLDLGPKG